MTSISTLGQALDQVERLKLTQLQLSTLQTQVATGKKTQVFSGLDTDVIASKRARANFAKLGNYVNNIDIAQRRIKMMVSALNTIKTQAASVLNAIEIQTQQGEYEIEAVSNLARNTATFLRDLINTKDGDRYLFGGAETREPPLANIGTMETYLLTQLDNWINSPPPPGDFSTDNLIASYNNRAALTDTIIGYAAPLSNGTAKNAFVRVEEKTEINYTVFANHQGIRDIITGVNMLAQIDKVVDEITLDPDDQPPPGTVLPPGANNQERNDNFYKFFNDLASMMNRALDSIDSELYTLSQSQAQITKIREGHKIDQNILSNTIAEVEDVDINEVAVKLNALQIQLEASFRVTATVSRLSLVNFL